MATNVKQERTLSWRDNIGYNIGNVSNAFVFGMVAMYLTYFFTDYLKIGAAVAGTVFLVARIFDAVNDPIMGYLVDKTNTRWGRFRPYILFGAVPLGVFSTLCFFAPDLSLTGRIIWAFATYIPLGVFQTLLLIPWHAQTVVMTTNPAERSEIAGVSAVIFQIGVFLVASLTIPLKNLFTEDIGFFYVAIIFAVLGTIGWYVCFRTTKKYDRPENYLEETKTRAGFSDIKSRLRMAIQNKPFVFVSLATFFNFTATTITQATIIYFFRYYFRMEWLFGPVMGGFAAVTAIGAMLMSIVSRKKGKRTVYMTASLGFSTCLIIAFISLWIHGPALVYDTSFIAYMVTLTMVVAFFNGPITALIWSMLPDTVEYGEWKLGVRSEGVLYSFFSFIMKMGSSIGGALTGFLLAFFNYVPNEDQTDETLFGISVMLYLVPAIMQLLAFAAIYFYKLDEETHRNIVKELKQKHGEEAK